MKSFLLILLNSWSKECESSADWRTNFVVICLCNARLVEHSLLLNQSIHVRIRSYPLTKVVGIKSRVTYVLCQNATTGPDCDMLSLVCDDIDVDTGGLFDDEQREGEGKRLLHQHMSRLCTSRKQMAKIANKYTETHLHMATWSAFTLFQSSIYNAFNISL